jgi:glucans biosynthesis protein
MPKHPNTFLTSLALFSFAAAALHAEPFSFERLREKARQNAAAPYAESQLKLANYWKNLTYDQHRDIRFKMNSGLWANQKGPFSIDFFHPGWTAKKMVTIHQVTGEDSEPLQATQDGERALI